MSRLFLATERSLAREVVIKVLPPELASEVSAARFQREMSLAAQLQHPHVLPVLSAGSRDGLLFYLMRHHGSRSCGARHVGFAVRVLASDVDAESRRRGPQRNLLERGPRAQGRAADRRVLPVDPGLSLPCPGPRAVSLGPSPGCRGTRHRRDPLVWLVRGGRARRHVVSRAVSPRARPPLRAPGAEIPGRRAVSRILSLWSNCDPALKPTVAQAERERAAL